MVYNISITCHVCRRYRNIPQTAADHSSLSLKFFNMAIHSNSIGPLFHLITKQNEYYETRKKLLPFFDII